ncbi:hypothetical protein [Rhodococcus sp. 1168]|uniref:hypothetical protein n=1 Tax=Rhodococcus sp. 1168 TaxID=2018041 RepID=UPI000A0DAAB8|nr:hypothetical protein [Rhodococcus sp. 1168]ORI21167.1 hypothetical protein BJI47_17145 [Rhodococcus sp. 1168]
MPYRSSDSSWVTSGWWAADASRTGRVADESISRTQLIQLWVKAAPEPKPNVKHLAEDLAKWMSELGSTAWVVQTTSPEAARRMRQGINQVLDERDIWDDVSTVTAQYADPFARCSAGVVTEVKRERPRGLPNAISTAVRRYEDGPPRTAARNSMIAEVDCGTVTASRPHADTFVENLESYRDAIVAAAMRAYSGKLTEYLERTDDHFDESTRATLIAALDDLTERYGEPDAADRLPTPVESRFVDETLSKFLTARAADQPASDTPLLQGSTLYTTADVAGEAWRRANRNLLRLHINAVPLDDELIARVYGSNLKRATQDLQRKLLREEHHRSVSDRPADIDTVLTQPQLYLVPDHDLGHRSAMLRALFRQAWEHVSNSDVESTNPWEWTAGGTSTCWERRTVLEILGAYANLETDHYSELVDNIESGQVERAIAHRYDTERPADTLAENRKASISFATRLLRGALAISLHDDDILGGDGFEVVGQRASGQTWAQKTAEVLRTLHGYRENWNLLTESTS